jgi:hypothetical protein
MSLKDLPHFEVEAKDLAAWLDTQGPTCWWSVDGDPRLTGELSFPCPSDDLAAKLREVDEPLILFDPKERTESLGQRVDIKDLEGLTYTDEETHNRLFRLGWKLAKRDSDWLLAEDRETAELFRSLNEEQV